MFWTTVIGTAVLIPIAVYLWLGVSHEIYPPAWEYASVVGYIVVAIVWLPVTFEIAARSGWGEGYIFLVPNMFYGCAFALVCQIIFEDTVVPVPAGVDPAPDRWPESIQRAIEPRPRDNDQ